LGRRDAHPGPKGRRKGELYSGRGGKRKSIHISSRRGKIINQKTYIEGGERKGDLSNFCDGGGGEGLRRAKSRGKKKADFFFGVKGGKESLAVPISRGETLFQTREKGKKSIDEGGWTREG